jgi:hypothetical protein
MNQGLLMVGSNSLITLLSWIPLISLYKCDYNNQILLLKGTNKNPFKLDMNFIQWLVGFTDGKGNFSMTLRWNKNNTSNLISTVQLTFQIMLHIDDCPCYY